MNKVENLSINGVVFYIEDEAYESLNQYLDALKKYFLSQPDGPEVIGDIEARIAELFSEKSKGANVVISLKDVREVVATLGTPEDIANVDADTEQTPASEKSRTVPPLLPFGYSKMARKFYRDPEKRIFGGVCAGLSVLWDIPVWAIRLIFFLSPFITLPFTGFFFHLSFPVPVFLLVLLYVILWIVIPKANTPARRLAMMGQPVTVEGLRSIREQSSDYASVSARIMAQSKDRVSMLMTKFLGVIFVLSGIGILISAILAFSFQSVVFESDWEWAYYPFSHLLPDMFNPTLVSVWEILLVLTILIPIILLISLGVKFLFQKMKLSPMIWGALVGCWFLVLISGVFVAFEQSARYAFEERVTTESVLKLPAGVDTLHFKVMKGPKLANNPLGAFYNEAEDIYVGMPEVYVEASSSDRWEITINKWARGASRLEASETSERIGCAYKQDGSILLINPYFSVSPSDKWSFQRVNITVRVPKGKFLHLDPSLECYYGHFWGQYWEHKDRGSRGLMLSTTQKGRLYNSEDEQPDPEEMMISEDKPEIDQISDVDVKN